MEALGTKAEFIADLQQRIEQAILATPTGDLRNLLTDVNIALGLYGESDSGLRQGLRKVVGAGHNDDCLFCGFKDRAAGDALNAEPMQQP